MKETHSVIPGSNKTGIQCIVDTSKLSVPKGGGSFLLVLAFPGAFELVTALLDCCSVYTKWSSNARNHNCRPETIRWTVQTPVDLIFGSVTTPECPRLQNWGCMRVCWDIHSNLSGWMFVDGSEQDSRLEHTIQRRTVVQ